MRCSLLTLVCLIACKDKPVEVPPPPPAPPHDGVTLIQPGTAPFHVLRYQLTKGARTTSTLVCDFAIKSDGQGEATPTLIVELEAVVDDVLADGSAKLRFTLTRAQLREVPGTAAPADLQAQATALQGVVITELLAPDGKSSGAKVEPAAVPDKARAQLDSLIASLEHVAVQLPTEPVGKDATWQERRTLPAGGISGISEILYTVTAVGPASFSYASTGVLSATPQTLEREGMKVEVSNTTGHSTAKGTVELTRYALDVEVSSEFSSTMNAIAPKDAPGSGSSTVAITMATRMTPGTTPPAAAPSPGADQGAHSAP